MKLRLLASLVVVLLLPVHGYAQPVARTFLELRQKLLLPIEVEVLTRDGKRFRGAMVEVSNDTLVLLVDSKREVIGEQQVKGIFVFQSGRSRWRVIPDTLMYVGPFGAVAGVASGYCQRYGPAGRIVESLSAAAGFSLVVGVFAAMGGDDDYHPIYLAPSAEPATSFQDLRDRTVRGARVDVLEQNGEWTTGALVEVARDSVILRVSDGSHRTIPQSAILLIDVRGDRVWDGAAIGAGIGAGWGLWMARICSDEDPVTRAPQGDMASWGAAILGITWLVFDLAHQNRLPIYRHLGASDASIFIAPVVPRGGGLGVVVGVRF